MCVWLQMITDDTKIQNLLGLIFIIFYFSFWGNYQKNKNKKHKL
jgi:hypothetical protein